MLWKDLTILERSDEERSDRGTLWANRLGSIIDRRTGDENKANSQRAVATLMYYNCQRTGPKSVKGTIKYSG